MKVVVINNGETLSTEVVCANLQSCLSLLKLNHGRELTDAILAGNFKFLVSNNSKPEDVTPLTNDVLLSDLSTYDNLFILEDVGGELPAAAIVAAWGAVGVVTTATSTLVTVTSIVLSLAVSVISGAIMNALSPSPEFNSDPSGQQKTSNLFNGGVVGREQGGIVPFIFGRCFTGGTLISAGVSTTED
jgi:hypothetical protein